MASKLPSFLIIVAKLQSKLVLVRFIFLKPLYKNLKFTIRDLFEFRSINCTHRINMYLINYLSSETFSSLESSHSLPSRTITSAVLLFLALTASACSHLLTSDINKFLIRTPPQPAVFLPAAIFLCPFLFANPGTIAPRCSYTAPNAVNAFSQSCTIRFEHGTLLQVGSLYMRRMPDTIVRGVANENLR